MAKTNQTIKILGANASTLSTGVLQSDVTSKPSNVYWIDVNSGTDFAVYRNDGTAANIGRYLHNPLDPTIPTALQGDLKLDYSKGKVGHTSPTDVNDTLAAQISTQIGDAWHTKIVQINDINMSITEDTTGTMSEAGFAANELKIGDGTATSNAKYAIVVNPNSTIPPTEKVIGVGTLKYGNVRRKDLDISYENSTDTFENASGIDAITSDTTLLPEDSGVLPICVEVSEKIKWTKSGPAGCVEPTPPCNSYNSFRVIRRYVRWNVDGTMIPCANAGTYTQIQNW